jgi:transposase InsO family protein
VRFEVLERVCRKLGYPKSIRVDQGPEFISKDLDLWAYRRGVILDFGRPGKPTDNAFIENLSVDNILTTHGGECMVWRDHGKNQKACAVVRSVG